MNRGVAATDRLITDESLHWHFISQPVAWGFGDSWIDALEDLRRGIQEMPTLHDYDKLLEVVDIALGCLGC